MNGDQQNLTGWDEWGRHVLQELRRHHGSLDDIEKAINKIYVEIAMLKVKSGAWGALGGAIPVLIALGVWLLTKKQST